MVKRKRENLETPVLKKKVQLPKGVAYILSQQYDSYEDFSKERKCFDDKIFCKILDDTEKYRILPNGAKQNRRRRFEGIKNGLKRIRKPDFESMKAESCSEPEIRQGWNDLLLTPSTDEITNEDQLKLSQNDSE